MRLFARQQSGTHSHLLRHTYGQLRGILHDPKNNIAAYGVANENQLHILGHVSSQKSYFVLYLTIQTIDVLNFLSIWL